MRLTQIVSLAGLTCMFASASAAAQPSVLIAAAASAASTDCRYLDTQAKLLGTGMFSTVDVHNASTSGTLPTLAQLLAYDVVLTWSNSQWNTSATAMGDLFADYVDAGGAVVVGVFANASIPLAGRWVTGGYELITGGGQTSGFATLGTVHDPSHPIMAGVSTFSGGSSSYRPTTTILTPGSVSIADWSDNRVLVAVNDSLPGRVDLAMYPPSSDCRSDFWDTTTDGAILMANALVFAAGGGHTPCYADCDGNEVLNIDDFLCFINEFAQAQGLPVAQQITHYANCDGSTSIPTLTIDDFLCFINEFAQGCP